MIRRLLEVAYLAKLPVGVFLVKRLMANRFQNVVQHQIGGRDYSAFGVPRIMCQVGGLSQLIIRDVVSAKGEVEHTH